MIHREKPGADTEVVLYTSISRTYNILYIANNSEEEDFATVALLKSGETGVQDKEIYPSLRIPPHDTFITSPIPLDQTESIAVKSAGGNLVFTLLVSSVYEG